MFCGRKREKKAVIKRLGFEAVGVKMGATHQGLRQVLASAVDAAESTKVLLKSTAVNPACSESSQRTRSPMPSRE